MRGNGVEQRGERRRVKPAVFRVPLDLDIQKRRLQQLRIGRDLSGVNILRRALAAGIPLVQLASVAGCKVIARRRKVTDAATFSVIASVTNFGLALHNIKFLVRNEQATTTLEFRLVEVIENERFVEQTIITVPAVIGSVGVRTLATGADALEIEVRATAASPPDFLATVAVEYLR